MITITQILQFIVLLGAAGAVLWGVYKFIRFLDDLNDQRDEGKLILHAVFACLDGLQQLGANGKVTETREKLENYVIDK